MISPFDRVNSTTMCQLAPVDHEGEPTAAETVLTVGARLQRTLGHTVSYSGIGVHTGEDVVMQLIPAEPGTGIVFQRSDLPGQPLIPATVEYATGVARQTTLAVGNALIQTPEHVLAALRAYDLDNVIIALSSQEPPVGDGSSDIFVKMIESADIVEQEVEMPVVKLQQPLAYSDGDVQLVAIPSDEFRISYTLHYPNSPVLGSQFFSSEVTSETFSKEIAPCRTFCLYEEISYLIDQGLIKGGTLDNAVVIKDDAILSKGGLRFPDEAVRHKVLDLIGDLSLIGIPLLAHVIAIRSGHRHNVAFARKLFNHLTRGKS